MGEILLKYYQFVGDKRGIEGKLKLAQSTRMPSSVAAMQPDSSENVELFRKAVKDITGQDPGNLA